jgi:23S rRNA pseudouridine2605 synthase
MIRLQKIIADSGYCSRRKAEAYIEAGAVKVNGHPAKLGATASPKDIITINGERVAVRAANPRYIKMYKPRGVLCSMSDPHAGSKKLITDLLRNVPERVYPVGRLDANSEGLILLTNDGDFANRVTHPRNGIRKTYRVTISGKVTEEQAAFLSAGVDLGEGERSAPCAVDFAAAEAARTVLLITIAEGKNRQIRRMCEALGLNIARLKRVSVGGVKLGLLKPGEFADLSKQEVKLLYADYKK